MSWDLYDEPGDLTIDPGPMLDALLAGLRLGLKAGAAGFAVVGLAAVAVDKLLRR